MKKFHTKKLPVIQGKRIVVSASPVIERSIVGIITITDISFAKPEMAKEFMDTYVTPRWID